MAPATTHTCTTLVVVTVITVAFAQGSAAGMATKDVLADGPETVFFDDFAGPTLDRSKWRVEIAGRTVNNEQQAYIDSGETISIARGDEAEGASNGALVLQARYRPGFMTSQNRKYDFVSGRIDTRGKFNFTYGTAAARIKLSPGPGLWPAWWALGNGRWPDAGEIDIMEYVGETDWTGVALHGRGYSGETPLVNKFFFPRNKDATAWHIYSVDWTPKGLVFKVDGEVSYRATRPMIEHYGLGVRQRRAPHSQHGGGGAIQ